MILTAARAPCKLYIKKSASGGRPTCAVGPSELCKLYDKPTCIDGISGADNIAQMWRDHYSDIFNSVNQSIDAVYNVDESRAVRELVANKSCGIDGIYAEHMLYLFFSCFVSFARPLYV